MLGNAYGGLDHYWRELSGDVANILGSRPLGWLRMPNAGNYYAEAYRGGYRLNMTRATDDCLNAADPQIDFSPYDGVVILLPLPADKLTGTIWAFGGSMYLKRDGPGRYIRAAWIPVEIGAGAGNVREVPVSLLAHEMGHGFGLPHSSGPYGQVYDSRWDVMSGAFGVCSPEPVYGCPSQHTMGYHKELISWIPDGRKVVIPSGTAKLVELMRLAQPKSNGYLLAQIPLEDADHFYTVEARRIAGYDYRGLLPGEAIVIHEVDKTRSEPAHVIDADGNGDVNDEGAMWRTGETFTGRNGVTVCVAGSTATGFFVGIGNGQTPQCELAADLSSSATSASNSLPNAGQTATLYTDLVNMHATAQGVVVTSTLPAGTAYVTGTAKTSQGVVELTPAGELVFTVGALKDGAPARLSYAIRVNKNLRDPTVLTARSKAAWNGGSLPLTHTLIANAERVNLPSAAK
ncbi:MAG: DUF11 domain-containing protein [Anaerolineales bacterium]|nr:DUF11 domain-containing protein [Anaerolineales bacterium]